MHALKKYFSTESSDTAALPVEEPTVDTELKSTDEEAVQETEVTETETSGVDSVTDGETEVNVIEAPETVPATTVDAADVTATAEPAAEVTEAGDDIGQATPVEEVTPNTAADVSASAPADTGDIPAAMAGGTDIVAEAAQADAAEVNSIVEQGQAAKTESAAIVEAATADAAELSGEGASTDVNGNALTEEQAETNEVQAEKEAEVEQETQAEEEAEASETQLNITEADAAETTDESTDATDGTSEVGAGNDSGTDAAPDFGDASGDLGDGGDITAPPAEETEAVPGENETPAEAVVEGDVNAQNAAADETADTAAADADVVDSTDVPAVDAGVTEETAPLDVEATQDLTPAEVDGTPEGAPGAQDDTAATVEETPESETVETVEETEETAEQVNDDATDLAEEANLDSEVDGLDVDSGEVAETIEDADLEEDGELDIPDVDDEVTEDEVADAVIEADEVEEVADAEEAEAELGKQTIEDLQKEKEAVESFMDVLKYGLESGKFEPQTVALVQNKLDELYATIGPRHSPKIPAMENYTSADDLSNYYMHSLESFRGFMSRLTEFTETITEKVEQLWHTGLTTKVIKRAEAVNKELDLVLVKLSQSDVSSKQEVKGITGYLATSETNLNKAVAADLRVVSEISVKGFKANEALQKSIADILNEVINKGRKGEYDGIIKKALVLKPVKSSYPESAFSGALIGGWKLDQRPAKGGSSTEGRLQDLGVTGIPVAVKGSVSDRVTAFTLGKADLADLLKVGKAYTALAKKLAETVGHRALDQITEHRLLHNRATPTFSATSSTRRAGSWDESKSIDELAGSLLQLAKSHHDIYRFVTNHALEVAQAIIKVVNKAI